MAVFPIRAHAKVFALAAEASGFNGAARGPLLRVKAGETLALRFRNALASPAALAFPGLRVPNALCGFAGLTGAALSPGETRELALTPREPGFNLYTAYGPEAGPFGPIVVDEASQPTVELDLAVVLSDDDGRLRIDAGFAPLTLSAPPGGRVRLRLGNAGTERSLLIKIEGAVAVIVAIDGAPSEVFAPRGNAWPMAPSSRFELMLDMPASGRVSVAAGDAPALAIVATGDPVAAKPEVAALPSRLPREIPLERALQAAAKLTGDAARGYAINGVAADGWPAKPLFKVARGRPVSLALSNATAEPQTIRLEGHVARQLHALDDGWDPYWRDALTVGPGKTSHFAFFAENPGRWPIASASPRRRGRGLIAWCEVV